jgi:hypothetical protein
LNAAKKIILLLWLLLVASLGNVSASTPGAGENRVWEKSLATLETRQGEPQQAAGRHQGNGSVAYDNAVDCLLAAEGGVLNGANYAQRTFSSTFSSGGTFAGQTVEDVAAALRSGTLSPADVPIQYIVQDGNTLMLNTRSAQALEQAGIPRAAWNGVDMMGDAAAQARLAAQLQRNGLGSQGIPTVTPGH